MVPHREPRLMHLQLVPLAPGRALAVLVGEDGAVENRVLNLPMNLPAGALDGSWPAFVPVMPIFTVDAITRIGLPAS